MKTHEQLPLFNQMGSSYDIDRSASSAPLHELECDLGKSLLEVSAIESTGGFRFPVDLECNRNQGFSSLIRS